MDPGTVKTFCDAAAQLLTQLGEYAAVDLVQRKPEDEALVRQLRIAASGIGDAIVEIGRMMPPPLRPMPIPPTQPRSPNVGAPS